MVIKLEYDTLWECIWISLTTINLPLVWKGVKGRVVRDILRDLIEGTEDED